jgi:superfamily II DNA or RNA helicase
VAAPIRLRPWQREALSQLERSSSSNFLAVATPGAGKTTFALSAVRHALVQRRVRRCVVVVPTQHLKLQWAHAAEPFDIHLDPDWSAGDGALPSDVHGVAVTYQQVAANPEALRSLMRGAFVVLDEIHHAADSRSWGDGVRHAFEHAWLRLCLSGTPFRSDQSTIPFVRYEGDEAVADYEYGYGEALEDRRVVRPVYFPRISGRMEWTSPDGQTYAASFDDPLGRTLSSQRLRTALDLSGDWLPTVLSKAQRQLLHLRERDPRAAGMVIAMDQDHARGIAKILRERTGVVASIATSDDPTASRKIADFGEGDAPWIVAVRMVSEGVDIPRLRVGVYATNTVTDLFFRQAVGRLVRFSGSLQRQSAYMFIPDDWRLRTFAFGIAEQRRHSLRKPDEKEDFGEAQEEEPEPAEAEAEEQLSLFQAISAVPLDEEGKPLEPSAVYAHEEHGADDAEEIPDLVGDDEPEGDDSFALVARDLHSAVPSPEPEPTPASPPGTRSARSKRRELRERNSACVRSLVRVTRKGHADINAELNRQSGVRRVTEASVSQLERRLKIAERWLARL